MHEAKPCEILDDRLFVFRFGSLPIVILDSQQHPAVAIMRSAPHMQGIDDVSEVEMACWSGSEPCQHAPFRIPLARRSAPRNGGSAPLDGRLRPLASAQRSSGTGLAYKPTVTR